MQRNRQVKEFGLYVHIPFCVQKCRYCDFLSAPAPEDVRRAYSRKLQEEIAAAAEIYRDCQVTSIFIGGGTPSLLSVAQASSLMGQLRNCFLVRENAEITIECNPETLYADKLEVYHRLGINRLSIGLQSADAAELELLGRIHTYEKFVQAYQLAREAGFANINVDVMAALPGQTVSAYAGTVRKLIALRPEHISAYSLMIEEGTAFYERYHQAELLREKGREQHALPSEEEERSM